MNQILSVIEEDEREIFEDKELDQLITRKEAFNIFIDSQVDLFYEKLTPKQISKLEHKLVQSRNNSSTPDDEIFNILDEKQYLNFKRDVESRIDRLAYMHTSRPESPIRLPAAKQPKHDSAELKRVNSFLDQHLDELLEGQDVLELQNDASKLDDLLNQFLKQKRK